MSRPPQRAEATLMALSSCVAIALLVRCFLGISCGRISNWSIGTRRRYNHMEWSGLRSSCSCASLPDTWCGDSGNCCGGERGEGGGEGGGGSGGGGGSCWRCGGGCGCTRGPPPPTRAALVRRAATCPWYPCNSSGPTTSKPSQKSCASVPPTASVAARTAICSAAPA